MKELAVFLKAILLVATILLFIACGNKSTDQSTTNNRLEPQPVNVRIQELRPRPFAEAIQVPGIVKAYEDVKLSPEEGGVVKEWRAQKGQFVKKGEIIALLKDDIIRASYEAAEAQYKLAQLNYEKQEKVFTEQSISEIQYKSAEYNRDAARAQADLMKARWEHTQIKSPINGVLDDRYVDEGEFAPPAVPMAYIVNTSMVKILAEIPELHATAVRLGTPVSITFDALPADTMRGKISYVGKTVSPTNRTLPVEIYLNNPQGKLKPEMVAKVRVITAARDNALLISENLVLQVDKNKLVVYVENGGKAEERIVKLGGRQGNMVEIVSGLAPGDRVIVSGFQKLVHGNPVNVVE
ncbi:MAG: efflux RND transporter periplasmic adaptor subunit [candidate division KSB1 bacterium]|nr:efflux RND transporter periplasmic adaptor subunit [candidate division KSB1 bacterium]MDZ7304238.1 efflux RND transporter periplasmic adaptor subunit [candidate division KSB1 bacterium]MDZ7311713.1 efflux RND transporter periplasmic adaptor subunit [candidate division KSB1 bacterium]